MKTNKDFILREIVGESVLIPTGKAANDINGMIHLSDTAIFIWKLYDQKENLEEIVKEVINEFEIDEETARRDVYGFSEILYNDGIILDIPEFEAK